MLKTPARPPDLSAAVVAGLAGGIVYVAVMEIDNRLLMRNLDDLEMLGRPFMRDRRAAKLLGIALHLANSAILGVIYAAAARDRLPGSAWLRGVLYTMIEDATLYPIALLERFHPGVENGGIERYWTLASFLHSIPRHVAYGAVTGLVYERLLRKSG